jgi:hypothetical protein
VTIDDLPDTVFRVLPPDEPIPFVLTTSAYATLGRPRVSVPVSVTPPA